jgi:hypothetical protein
MAWTTPRTWATSEVVTSAMMNEQIRDNFGILKTRISNSGWPLHLSKGFGYNGGQGNAASASDTELTSYTHTIPANTLGTDGSSIVFTMLWVRGATAGTAIMKFELGGSGKISLFSESNVSTTPWIRFWVTRRSSTTAALGGNNWSGANSGGAPTVYLFGTSLSGLTWGSDMSMKFYSQHTTASQLTLAYTHIQLVPSTTGAVV